jgi:FkbM family methyltransferase
MPGFDYMLNLKKLVTHTLPPSLLFGIKKRYYARVIRSFWEPDVEPIKYLVKPGDAVIDIGANAGWYTMVLSTLVGQHGTVYSIEPIHDTFQILLFIINKMCLKNVRPLNYAISDKDGSAVMEIPLHIYGGPNFYQARIITKERTTNPLQEYTVHITSIDSLLPELPENITFVKCDVEGHELSVIKGASHFFLKSKPACLIEISEDPDDEKTPSKEVFDRLKDLNYTPYWFDGKKLNKRLPGDKSVNYFFLQPSHLTSLAFLIADEKA